MRSPWLALIAGLAACDGGGGSGGEDAAAVDADLCLKPPPNVNASGCATDGLGALSLDGEWQLDGTASLSGGAPMPYSAVKYLKRTGTGWCVFAISSTPIGELPRSPDIYINDTIATYNVSGSYPHPYSYSWTLCVSASDGSLSYRQRDVVTMPMQDRTIVGVLTRPN